MRLKGLVVWQQKMFRIHHPQINYIIITGISNQNVGGFIIVLPALMLLLQQAGTVLFTYPQRHAVITGVRKSNDG